VNSETMDISTNVGLIGLRRNNELFGFDLGQFKIEEIVWIATINSN